MKQNSLVTVLLFTLLLTGLFLAFGCETRSGVQVSPPLSLCELVNNWRKYHGKQVRVRAIYRAGPEQAWLYDPACRNGEGLVSVSFFQENTNGVIGQLHQLVDRDERRRAWVVLDGVFYGPEPYGERVDPKLPAPIKEKLEKAPRRYGHFGFENMIEVSRVIEATKVE